MNGAIVYGKDMSMLAQFYSRVADLNVQSTQSDHIILGAPAFQLVVVQIPRQIAQSIQIEQPPVRRESTPIKLVFSVESIAAARGIAETLRGRLDPVEREWRFQGSLICDGCDPEGNVFQLREVGS
jgi:hypothetical protein